MNRRAAGSSPVDGSSRNSTVGACIRARAIIIRWICPPEKSSGLPSWPVGQAELVEQGVGPRPCGPPGARRGSWRGRGGSGAPRASGRGCSAAAPRRAAGGPPPGRPPRRHRPPGPGRAVGRIRVVRIPMVVVLPAPLGPRKPNTSPWRTRKVTPANGVDRSLRVPLDQVGDLDGHRAGRRARWRGEGRGDVTPGAPTVGAVAGPSGGAFMVRALLGRVLPDVSSTRRESSVPCPGARDGPRDGTKPHQGSAVPDTPAARPSNRRPDTLRSA